MKAKMFKEVGLKVGTIAGRAGLKLKKASPEILLIGGIAVGVAGVVAACMATKKITEDKVVEKAHEELDDIQAEEIDDPKERKKLSFRVYRHLIFEFAKRYGLSAFLLILSVTLILSSHGVLKKRYISTTVAYKALDEAFKDYRKRIQDAVGKEKEIHFFNGTEECGEVIKIDENGVSESIKDNVQVHKKKNSPYEFDWNARTAPGNWEANSDYNLMFLRGVQNWSNDLLNSRGHVFLNEVLDGLGLPRTREGAVVGWLKGCGGDDFVDFGIYEYYVDDYSDIQDGKIKNIHLNFNVDGLIWDKI